MPKKNNANSVKTLQKRLAKLEVKSNPNNTSRRRKQRAGPIKGKGAYSSSAAANNSYMSGNNFSLLSGVWNGAGAYSRNPPLRQNTLLTGNQVPYMHSNAETVTMRHREFICDINSSSAFTSVDYAINPGLASSFPYLSSIANSFQEYNFEGLIYEFKSTSADALNSTNTALGTINMVASYRSDAPLPSNKLEVLNEMWSCSTKPSESMFLPIECAPVENPLAVQYIRSDALSTTQDPKFYDLARLQISSVGSQATAVVGELWATYEVTFRKPSLASASGPYAANTASYAALLVTTVALPQGVQAYKTSSGITISVSGDGAGTGNLTVGNVTFGARYLVTFYWVAATSAAVGAMVNTYGCSFASAFQNGASSSSNSGDTTTNVTYQRVVEANVGGTFTMTWNATVVGATSLDIKVAQVTEEYL